MKKLFITSLALLSLSATSFAGICVRESSNFDNFFAKYGNIIVPQSVDTIVSAERVVQLTQTFSEVATTGPVQSGLGEIIIQEAGQLERTITARAKDTRALEKELFVAQAEMMYCLKDFENYNCIEKVNKLAEFDQKGLLQVSSIYSSALEIKNLYGALGEKLQALSRSGQPAHMTDFQPTLLKAQLLASQRDSYINQAQQEIRIRRDLSQAMKECLNSNN